MLQRMSPFVALRDILQRHAISIAFGAERTFYAARHRVIITQTWLRLLLVRRYDLT